MAFSKQAIGFYLEVEDKLTPALAKADTGYRKFVRSLDRYNTKAFKSASSGMASLAKLLRTLETLPKKASGSYDSAVERIKKKASKAIKQPIDLVFTTRSMKELGRAIGAAVADALSKSKIRLRASMPQTRLKMFDTGVSLRTAYSNIAQPPDMLGKLEIQRFAEGGIVQGGIKGKDSVPAFLQPGEVVLPVKLVDFWRKTSEKATKGVALLSSKFKDFHNFLKQSNREGPKFDKNLKRYRDNMGRFVSSKNLKGLDRMRAQLDEIGDNTKTLTFFATLAGAGEAIKDLGSNVSGAFSEIEGGETQTFIESMNELNQNLGLSRDQLRELKSAAVDAADAGGAGLNEMGMAMAALTEAGVTNTELMTQLGASIANMATASNADVGALSTLSYRLADGFSFSADTITNMFNATRRVAQTTAIDAATLIEQMEAQTKSMAPLLSSVSQETGAAILTNMAAVTGALSENWGDAGGAITESMSRALGGSIEDIRLFQTQFGMSLDEVRSRLESGDMAGMFDDLAGKINSMSPVGLNALKEAMQFEGELSEFAAIGTNIENINSNLGRLSTQNQSLLAATDGMEQLGTAAENNRTFFESLAKSFTMTVSQAELFGVSGSEVLDFFKEMNPMSVLATANLVKMAGQGFGSLLNKIPGVTSAFGAFAGKLGGFFGKGGPTAALQTAAGAGGGAGGMGIRGLMEGFAAGLRALGTGLVSFGTAMIGPGGLGLAALVAGLIGVGFAIKLAAPLFEMLGQVISKMIDGFVEMFKTITELDYRQMLSLGPALVMTAGGVSALALATGALGLAMGAAAIGVGAFRLATGGSGLASGGIASVIHDLVGGFEPITKDSKRLTAVNQVMEQLVSFMVDFSKLALIIGGLSVGASIASAVNSVLGFFGVDSPMESLSKQGRQMTTTLVSLIQDFGAAGSMVAGLDPIVAQMDGMLGFVKQYSRLADTIAELPGQSALSNLGEAFGNFFGADSPLEKLSEDAGPILETLSKLTTQFSALQISAGAATGAFAGVQAGDLTQRGAREAVSGAQLQTVVEAVLARADESPLHTDLLENNRLLAIIAGNTARVGGPVAVASAPARMTASQPRPTSAFARGVAAGDF